jgi:hypothetical protein
MKKCEENVGTPYNSGMLPLHQFARVRLDMQEQSSEFALYAM